MLRFLLALFTVAVLMQSQGAFAQSDPGRDAEARGLFEAGRAAFDQGRYQDALEYFDRSYQLSRRPQLLYNLGQVHDRLRHDDEALQALTQYLKQVPGASNRQEVEHRIQALKQAMVGTLHFTVTPAAAQIWIDGEAKVLDASGKLQVSTGSHEILVRAEGYQELRQRMTVRGGDSIELPISLQPTGDAPLGVTEATQPVITETTPAVAPTPAVEAPATPTVAAPEQAVASSPRASQTSTATTLAWVTAVTSGLMLIGGTATALIGSSEFDALNEDCSDMCTRPEINKRGSSIKTMQTLTNVGLIGGGSLAALAVVLFIVGGKSSDTPPATQSAFLIGPTSIALQGSF